VDEEVRVCVRGLLPRQEVVIRAESRDDENRLWCSRAELRADVSGTVDVAQQESTGGSYRGVSQMGLFWSMRLVPEQTSGKSTFAKVGTSPNSVRFEVEVEGRVVASTHLERRFLPPGTATRDLNIHGDTAARIAGDPSGLAWGSVARLFMPPVSAGPGPFPAVVVLSGSGGGCDLDKAAVLSRHGFATLALAYFGIPPLPTWLHRVPLDYIEAALIWLAAQPEVDAQRIGALGFSRGSELALLMAAQFPQVRAVVGYAPSSVAWAAGGRDRSTKEVIPAWTWKGKALPCVPLPLRDFMLRSAFPVVALRRPAMFRNLFEAALQDREAVERAAIPVERINGSILLVSGGSDHVWPAAHMSEQIINRLKQHGFAHRVTHLNYPGAGHILRYPHLPTTPRQSRDPQLRNARFSFGGNAMDDAHAQADSWRGAIDFLKSQL
jgi:dienelactone hydrolase